jgi:hypothetical protein
MATEQGYGRQTRNTPAPMREAPQGNALIGLGKALEDTGDTLHKRQIRSYEVDRDLAADQQLTEGSRRLAEQTASVDAEIAQLQYGPDYEARVQDVITRSYAPVTEGITEQRVLTQLTRQRDQLGAARRGKAQIYAFGKRVERSTQDAEQALGVLENGVLGGGDPVEALGQWGALVGGLSLLDDAGRDKLLHYGGGRVVAAGYKLQANVDPDGAEARLKSGVDDKLLSPAQKEEALRDVQIARSRIAVEARRAQADADRQAREQRAADMEQVATVEASALRGDEVDPEIWESSIAMARAHGEEAVAVRLEGKRDENMFAGEYDRLTPAQVEDRISRLAGKEDRTQAENRELEFARSQQGTLGEKFSSDMVQWFKDRGSVPEIDWADPAALAQRTRWRRAQEGATGRRVPTATKRRWHAARVGPAPRRSSPVPRWAVR